jgi:hypothetical protein
MFIFSLHFFKFRLVLHFSEFFIEHIFEVGLNILLKPYSNWVFRVAAVNFFYVMLVHLVSYLHLHSVIAWGDSKHVPLYLVEIRVALEEMKECQVDKDQ